MVRTDRRVVPLHGAVVAPGERIDYEAYDLFLKARFLQQGNNREGVLADRQLLREAITREPDFASAYAELSIGFVTAYESDWCIDYSTARQEALTIAQQAVAIDQSNSNAHRALAMAEFYCNRDFDAARAHADMALAQNPNDQFTICLLGFALTCSGRVVEGQSYSAESFKLNPLGPETCFITLALGAYLDGRYADAVNGFVSGREVFFEKASSGTELLDNGGRWPLSTAKGGDRSST